MKSPCTQKKGFCSLGLLFAVAFLTPAARAISINYLMIDNYVGGMAATVTWDPSNPGTFASEWMHGPSPYGEDWLYVNGGVAFLDIFKVGTTLRVETWHTDTNGNYTSDYIDIFTLPVDITGAFPVGLSGYSLTAHSASPYVFRSIKGNPYGFTIEHGNHIDDTSNTAAMLAASLAALIAIRHRRS